MKRRNRLSRSRDFDAVYRQGRSVSTRYLVLYSFPARRRGGGGAAARTCRLAEGRRRGGAEPGQAPACARCSSELAGRPAPRTGLRADRPPGPRPRRRRANGFEWLGRTRQRGLPARRRRRPRSPGVTAIPRLLVRGYQRLLSPLLACSLQVPPDPARSTRSTRSASTASSAVSCSPAWRLLRCNPWSHGGVDYARDQTLFGGPFVIGLSRDPRADREAAHRGPRVAPCLCRAFVGVGDHRAHADGADRARAADGQADPLDAEAPDPRARAEGATGRSTRTTRSASRRR